ncbi:MAG: GntR family transcriptional regulator [Bermanella sp.]|jgi:GntR family transcriptional regulator|uniref:GntR family transcriptional regulator n=1 Tax=Glaciecola sp. 33A TaxID=2057807 RepID=UPI000C32C9F5|nr:GntR family transcriptional regulator [Glaciecola sp. 33A]PKI02884.1 GntR family transcriptional regulator [Glaciecola sp. 33A]
MITIELDSPEPLFNQLIIQIKKAIEAKQLYAGDALPSIRQLANDLDINSKTVAKAYRLLERDKVIETKGYRGTYVHPNALDNVQFNLNGWLYSQVSFAVNSYREAGATDSEIRIAFNQAMTNTKK